MKRARSVTSLNKMGVAVGSCTSLNGTIKPQVSESRETAFKRDLSTSIMGIESVGASDPSTEASKKKPTTTPKQSASHERVNKRHADDGGDAQEDFKNNDSIDGVNPIIWERFYPRSISKHMLLPKGKQCLPNAIFIVLLVPALVFIFPWYSSLVHQLRNVDSRTYNGMQPNML